MIKPIQQNVVFTGAGSADFAGNKKQMSACDDYNKAVNNVLEVQQNMANAVDSSLAKNIDLTV